MMAVLLAVCLMLGLCACTGPAEPSEESGGSLISGGVKTESEESGESSEEESAAEQSEVSQSSAEESSEAESSQEEKQESSESSQESSKEESESSKPSIATVYTPKAFTFPQGKDDVITVELAVPEDWYGYPGDIMLFRDTKDYEEIKAMEVSYAVRLDDPSDIDEYIADPGYEGSEIVAEKMYTGFSGSSVYYFKTKAAPMGGTHDLSVWYPCFYYVLMPDNTFVCLVFYGLSANDAAEYSQFDKIADSLSIRETAPPESSEEASEDGSAESSAESSEETSADMSEEASESVPEETTDESSQEESEETAEESSEEEAKN